MGIYDEKICQLEKQRDRCKSEIASIEKKIRDLEKLSSDCQKTIAQFNNSYDDLISNVNRKTKGLPSNFIAYYKGNYEKELKSSNYFKGRDKISAQKREIDRKKERYSEEKRSLIKKLESIEQEIKYYQSINTNSIPEG